MLVRHFHRNTPMTITDHIHMINTGDMTPPALDGWLPRGGGHDIYAIGVQECSYGPRAGYSSCEEDWFGTVLAHLGGSYALVEGIEILSYFKYIE